MKPKDANKKIDVGRLSESAFRDQMKMEASKPLYLARYEWQRG